MTIFVLDTSAILTILNREEGVETVLSLLDQAKEGQATIHLPFMALMELEYLLLRRLSPEETRSLLTLVQAWPVRVSESDPEWRHRAASVKANTPVSIADAWNASLALLLNAALVHKDPEYEHISGLQMVRLPYKV